MVRFNLVIKYSCLAIIPCIAAQSFQPDSIARGNNERKNAIRAQQQCSSPEEKNQEEQISDIEQAGLDAQNSRNFSEAERLIKKAINEAEKFYGKEHFKVAFLITRLGDIYRDWDKLDDAEVCFKRSLVIYNSLESSDREQIWGPAGGFSGMLQGGHIRGDCARRQIYLEWIARKHPDEAERNALVNKLDYIHEHPMEKASLDSSWGLLQSQM